MDFSSKLREFSKNLYLYFYVADLFRRLQMSRYSQWESRRNEWKEKLYKEHNEKFNIKHQRDPRPDLPYPSTIDDQDLWVKNIEILDQRLKDFVKMMTG